MNVALMEGLLEGLELDGITARLDPQPGMCCVVLQTDPDQDRRDKLPVPADAG
jgi:hypothetical protein